MEQHHQSYWKSRYNTKETGWDIGYASTAITAYIDQLTDKSAKILIPGAGNAYEAEYLHHNGFTEVHILDFVIDPLEVFSSRTPTFPQSHIHHQDFFSHQDQYDIIIEQTFFCALKPPLRRDYIDKIHELLKPEGEFAGLLFNIEFDEDKPPYGGNEAIYQSLFSRRFKIEHMAVSENSIPQRLGNELFFRMKPLTLCL